MKTHDRAASIFWVTIGVLVAVQGHQLGVGQLHQPGPGFIFVLSALGLVILALVDLGSTFAKTRGEEKSSPPIWRGLRWQKVLLILVGLSTYSLIFNIGGFLPSTFLLLIFLFKAVEPTGWLPAIVSSLITVALSYVIFVVALQVPFPKGFLGF